MEIWAFVLLALGLVFIVAEVFFPSFGLLGTCSVLSIAGGAVVAWRADLFASYLAFVVVLCPVVAFSAFKLLPKTPFGRRMLLSGSSFDPRAAAAGGGGAEFAQLLNQVGVASTPLRPAGKAQFGDLRVDVTTRGEMIEGGRRVTVVRVEGNRVFVAERKE